jgi:hypothetical protein
MDDVATFAAALPAWCHREGSEAGLPLTWRHFVYGMRHLGRAHTRTLLDRAQAARIGQNAGAGFVEWQRDAQQTVTPREPN